MEQTYEALLVRGICPIGAVVFLALAIFPFQYGPLEAVSLAVDFVAFSIFETVLNDTTF